MCCTRRPRGENIIRDQSKKPSPSCWGGRVSDGWTEGKDNIGFKNKNNKKTTTNVNRSIKRSKSRGTIHPQ